MGIVLVPEGIIELVEDTELIQRNETVESEYRWFLADLNLEAFLMIILTKKMRESKFS